MTAIQPDGIGTSGAYDATARLCALEAGNSAQRELARLARRVLDLADESTTTDEDQPDAYRTAIAGVDAIESIASSVEASKSRLIAEAYARSHRALLDGDTAPGETLRHLDGKASTVLSRSQITGVDLAVVLRISAAAAKHRVEESVRLVHEMPHTLDRLDRGELMGYLARRIVDATAELAPEQRSQLDAEVCAAPLCASGRTGPGATRATARAVGNRLDTALKQAGKPPETARKRRAGFAGRYVRFGKTLDGMTNLHGSLPAVQAAAIDALLNDLAGTATDDDPRTLEQRRADSFLACFTGPAALSPAAQCNAGMTVASFDEEGGFVVVDEPQNDVAQDIWRAIRLLGACLDLTIPDPGTARVDVTVPLDVLADAGGASSHQNQTAVVRGVGPIPDDAARRLARDAQLRRIVIDPVSGQPLDVGRRQPSERLRAAVLARDGHCRFPGCQRVASLDLDHLEPYRDDAPPEGQTAPPNLQVLCREHHRAKHQLPWRPVVDSDGVITWRNDLLGIVDRA
ncbi:HNH endonuclease signature motif containing protein [Blastococcus sp. Marseille-P5729]|uniref:HNH endonuclease signature motif containing protein n=1 Tax=Blastococcus sp. Marseille-P5729 TaxID=2086582 RepID=UPI00131D79F3|nr:HNH endonuclease signature motif containing protein [Blastococcus sp. Marseille-P5729]